MDFKAIPYKLSGKIQNYEWGTKNDDAYIPNLLGESVDKEIPYAEYWIGIHPKAPSDVWINEEKVSFVELLKKFPIEILGNRIAEKFNNNLPFLLKVLSINQALSIQLHPDIELAKILHKKDSQNYPDDNHKPEIAIAIDNLTALVGLKSISDLKETINNNPEIWELFSDDVLKKMEIDSDNEVVIKELYSEIMYAPKEKLEKCILEIKDRYERKIELNQDEYQFLFQYDFYGIDVGLISILLFNIVNLNSGEAIYTPAGIPHAYIKGNIVECMANSDNVVRAGLTPKYKDIETLIEMIKIDSSECTVDLYEKEDRVIYKTMAEEFEIEKLNCELSIEVNHNSDVHILLILEGAIQIFLNNNNFRYIKGEVVLIPAFLTNYTIEVEKNSLVYQANVPK